MAGVRMRRTSGLAATAVSHGRRSWGDDDDDDAEDADDDELEAAEDEHDDELVATDDADDDGLEAAEDADDDELVAAEKDSSGPDCPSLPSSTTTGIQETSFNPANIL